MISIGSHVVDKVSEPVRLTDILPSGQPETISQGFNNVDDLCTYLVSAASQGYKCRLINICRLGSWSPLQITHDMLEALGLTHRLGESFKELSTYFYKRYDDLEETSCFPIDISHENSLHGM